MTAGMNVTVKVWRFVWVDDEVGGAVPSGTILYDYVHARIMTRMPDQGFFEQGLETSRSPQFMLTPATLTIKEKDELEIIAPPNHRDFGKHFRVEGMHDVGFAPSDPRAYLLVSTTRSETAHGHNNQ